MSTPVGFIVSWKVPATVELETLREALSGAGLAAHDLAPDLKPAQLVARSAGFIAKLTSDSSARKLARPVSHTARQITREEMSDDKLMYTREASIELAPSGHTLQCDDPELAKMLPETTKTVHATRTASDVTRIVQKIVEEAGSDLIPVRAQGGAYFVPSGHGIITRVAKFLEAVGGELSTFACTLGHGTDESVSLTISEYLIKQIEELQESIDALNEKGIRSDVKNRRLSRVAELKEKIGTYASLLTTGTEKLREELERAELTLLAKLGPEGDDDPASIAPASEPIAA